MHDGIPANPRSDEQATSLLWRRWDRWTFGRAVTTAAFAAAAIAVTAWQLTMSSPILGACMFCTVSAAEVEAALVHDFWAIVSIALIPLFVGVLRGRWWWLALGAVGIIAAAFWSFSPVDSSGIGEDCTPSTCPNYSPIPDDITFSPR